MFASLLLLSAAFQSSQAEEERSDLRCQQVWGPLAAGRRSPSPTGTLKDVCSSSLVSIEVREKPRGKRATLVTLLAQPPVYTSLLQKET